VAVEFMPVGFMAEADSRLADPRTAAPLGGTMSVTLFPDPGWIMKGERLRAESRADPASHPRSKARHPRQAIDSDPWASRLDRLSGSPSLA